MNTTLPLLGLLTVAFVSAGRRPGSENPDGLSAEDVAAIKSLLETMLRAELAGDWAAAGDLCTDDHVAMPANRPALFGRQAWVDWMSSFEVSFTEMSAKIDEIDGRGELAYLRGRYSEAYVVGEGSEPIEANGKFLWILRKQPDGRWLVAVSIGNSDTAATEGQPSG